MAKVMIVDDNRDIVETLKSIMEMEGHETETAYDGEEFLERVESVNPDLVLLDVMMPGLTTKEILGRLKERKLNHFKIIFVTVVRFSEDERRRLMTEFNIQDFVTKPFNLSDLVKKVKTALLQK